MFKFFRKLRFEMRMGCCGAVFVIWIADTPYWAIH